MILVTGATGTTGSEVVRRLLERGEKVRAMSRRGVAVPGADAVRADFADPASLAPAVAGVSAVYLVTAPPEPVVDHDAALVEAARAAGVERIVKLGAISGGEPGTWHRRCEQPTRDSGLTWTVLRPATFASNMLPYAPMIAGGLPLPDWTSGGAVGIVDPRDVAAVAVEALTTGGHAGRAYTLTGPELLTFAQQVAVLQRVLGTGIGTRDATMDDARTMMLDRGMRPDSVEESVAGMTRLAEGGYAVLTGDVSAVLGRAPGTFAAWAADHRQAFGGAGGTRGAPSAADTP
ncbi:NAD(P)H-binding protein [Nocardiopsis mangrovi]|uniref:NAD(P)H-binding protein n=1 Tax=Nocardiopsis mangrovi TaxID=1179818 RepID=A0ABV9E3W6_9ACTN